MTGAQVRRIREHLGLSVKDFARSLSVSWGSVYHWEADRNPPGGRAHRLLRRLWYLHIEGPRNAEEAIAAIACILDISPGDAAIALLRRQRAEGETWAAAVERIVRHEERQRSAGLVG